MINRCRSNITRNNSLTKQTFRQIKYIDSSAEQPQKLCDCRRYGQDKEGKGEGWKTMDREGERNFFIRGQTNIILCHYYPPKHSPRYTCIVLEVRVYQNNIFLTIIISQDPSHPSVSEAAAVRSPVVGENNAWTHFVDDLTPLSATYHNPFRFYSSRVSA